MIYDGLKKVKSLKLGSLNSFKKFLRLKLGQSDFFSLSSSQLVPWVIFHFNVHFWEREWLGVFGWVWEVERVGVASEQES